MTSPTGCSVFMLYAGIENLVIWLLI